MSKIEELIKELCPNGVKFEMINKVVDLYYGKGNTIPKDGGNYPVYGCYGIVGYTSTYNNENTPIVGHIGSAGKVSWGRGQHFVTYNGTICKTRNKNILNSRYLYHILLNLKLENCVKGSQPFLSISDFGTMKIPVPPLEVQEEIVRILDKFRELEARKSQYEFWRDKLLKNTKNKVKFGDIAVVVRGGSPRPIQNFITDDDNGIPWIKIGDTNPNDKYVLTTKEKITIEGSKKSRIVKSGDFILSNSMSFGRPYILKIDGCIHDGWLSISDFEDAYIPDFLYYLLSSKPIQDMMAMKASIGTVKNLNANIVKSIELPLYNKTEQKK